MMPRWLTRRDRVPWHMRRVPWHMRRRYRAPGTLPRLLWAGPLIVAVGLLAAAVHAPGRIVVPVLDILVLLFILGLLALLARLGRRG
jgi:hypothetical protein